MQELSSPGRILYIMITNSSVKSQVCVCGGVCLLESYTKTHYVCDTYFSIVNFCRHFGIVRDVLSFLNDTNTV